MSINHRRRLKTLAASESGVVAAEFVLLFPLFLLIVTGIVEFGHLWYVRQALTNAGREGARAAVVYRAGTDAERETWAIATAETAVNNYLAKFLPAGSWTINDSDITITPNPETGDLTGGYLRVKVQANSYLLLLDKFIPAAKDLTLAADTTMRFE
jgi:Flp pilus assembly protein TadG